MWLEVTHIAYCLTPHAYFVFPTIACCLTPHAYFETSPIRRGFANEIVVFVSAEK